MSKEFKIGAGVACVGIAVALGQWLIPADKISYDFRFILVIGAVILCVVGVGLLLHVLWCWIFGETLFCYFSVYHIGNQPRRAGNGFQLLMTSMGVVEAVNYWISPWGIEPNGLPNDPYYSLDQQKPLIPIIHQGGFAWDRALPLGNYRIDFTTKQGNWYEHLELYMDNGQVKQRIRVTTEPGDRGRTLYSFED